MSETVAILRFREEESGRFESLFEAEIYPLWQEFKAKRKLIAATLAPALDAPEPKEGGATTFSTFTSRAERNTTNSIRIGSSGWLPPAGTTDGASASRTPFSQA